ncbi:hypothetical protein E2I00_017298, partial [Balaenoptera physalus]
MAGILRSIVQRPPGRLQMVTKGVEPLVCTDWIRHKFTKSRIPDKVFQPSPEDHEKYEYPFGECKTESEMFKHLIRIKPLKLPQGLPTEEDMSNTCLKSTGELVVGWLQNPTDQ